MKKYRKKPVEIEAVQWFTLTQDTPVRQYVHDKTGVEAHGFGCKHCVISYEKHGWIDTSEGGHIVCPGDWIIRGVKGEFYPCKPDIFELTYEEVED